jgi:hypothetical protein
LLALTACDCQYQLRGVVLDSFTQQPIQGVRIRKTDTTGLGNPFNRKTLTQEDGCYELYGIAGVCNEIPLFFTKEGYETRQVTFSNNSNDTILLQPLIKPVTIIFDLEEEFEILNAKKANDYPSSFKDTSICLDWQLSKPDIKTIIKGSRPISGHEWHYLFGHYPCTQEGELLQGARKFKYSINSGGWLNIGSADTTLLLGSFNSRNNSLFLDSAWTE